MCCSDLHAITFATGFLQTEWVQWELSFILIIIFFFYQRNSREPWHRMTVVGWKLTASESVVWKVLLNCHELSWLWHHSDYHPLLHLSRFHGVSSVGCTLHLFFSPFFSLANTKTTTLNIHLSYPDSLINPIYYFLLACSCSYPNVCFLSDLKRSTHRATETVWIRLRLEMKQHHGTATVSGDFISLTCTCFT